jgi:hypothetical protein
MYSENESFLFLEKLAHKKDGPFIDEVRSFDDPAMIQLHEAINALRHDHKALRNMVFKLRRIIRATVGMTTSLILNEAIERIIDETCECLDCERATVFLYDINKEQLWSKAAKGSDEIIRVPSNKGIVGNFV